MNNRVANNKDSISDTQGQNKQVIGARTEVGWLRAGEGAWLDRSSVSGSFRGGSTDNFLWICVSASKSRQIGLD